MYMDTSEMKGVVGITILFTFAYFNPLNRNLTIQYCKHATLIQHVLKVVNNVALVYPVDSTIIQATQVQDVTSLTWHICGLTVQELSSAVKK